MSNGINQIFARISSYNLFNYLLPGVLFAVMVTNVSSFNLIQDNIIIGAFIYYFIGLIVSRIGSLILEPFLRKISFLNPTDYHAFINASKKDDKIELLSEISNMYRTLLSMIVLTFLFLAYEKIELIFPAIVKFRFIMLLIILLLLFLFSYIKQSWYLDKRIQKEGL